MSDQLDLRVAALEETIAKLTAAQSEFDSGDTSWVLVSAVLVLFMTIPGLVLFYAGMVRTKNVLATVMQVKKDPRPADDLCALTSSSFVDFFDLRFDNISVAVLRLQPSLCSSHFHGRKSTCDWRLFPLLVTRYDHSHQQSASSQDSCEYMPHMQCSRSLCHEVYLALR